MGLRKMRNEVCGLPLKHRFGTNQHLTASVLEQPLECLTQLSLIAGQPVGAKNHILVEVRHDVPRGEGQHIAGWQEARRFILRCWGQRDMDNHLIAVKVRSETFADHRAQLNDVANGRREWHRVKRLKAIPVKGRLAISAGQPCQEFP